MIQKEKPYSGHRLREFRKSLGLNQAEFAVRVGVSQQYIAAVENRRTPSYRLVARIKEVFDIDVQELFF